MSIVWPCVQRWPSKQIRSRNVAATLARIGVVNCQSRRPSLDIETGREEPWELKDLRRTCATHHDEHVPESSVEILGHSVGGITYRRYAHRAPLAFRTITTLPQPTAFQALVKGSGSKCPCCRRRYADAG